MAKRRSRGTGSITQNESGYYCLYWIDATGRKRKKSLRTRNRKEAEQKAADFEKAIAAKDKADVLHEAAKARKIITEKQLPLPEVWNAYLKTRPTCSEGTQGNHRRNLTAFLDWLIARHPTITSWTQITDEIAQAYAHDLWATNIAAQTFNYHRASLQAITNAIAGRYGIVSNPWRKENVKRKSDEHQERQTLDTDKANRLLEATAADLELNTLMMLGAYAGMRLKDAALLQWRSVDFATNSIEYRPHKTRRRNKVATVPITPPLRQALEKLDAGDHNGAVLPTIADEYENHYDRLKTSLLAVIRTVAPDLADDDAPEMQRKQTRRAAGFHALRHYFCSTCANKGIPAAQLERMTGDQAKTLGKFYVKGEVNAGAVESAFALPAPAASDPEAADRAKLAGLVQAADIETVRKLLEVAKNLSTS